MADRNDAVPENVPGPYFTDRKCLNCGMCVQLAPENFGQGDYYAYVQKQPENAQETEACAAAKMSCPVEAIGDEADVAEGIPQEQAQ